MCWAPATEELATRPPSLLSIANTGMRCSDIQLGETQRRVANATLDPSILEYTARVVDVVAQPLAVSVAAFNVFTRTDHDLPAAVRNPLPGRCAESQFLATQTVIESWRCETCPTGALCGGRPLGLIRGQAGTWYAGGGTVNVPVGSVGGGVLVPPVDGAAIPPPVFVPCQLPAACLGASSIDDLAPIPTSGFLSLRAFPGDRIDDAAACAAGYSGRLCDSCLPGFVHGVGQLTCQRCLDRSTVAGIFMLGVIAATVAVAILIGLALRGSTSRVGSPYVALAKILATHIQVRLAVAHHALPHRHCSSHPSCMCMCHCVSRSAGHHADCRVQTGVAARADEPLLSVPGPIKCGRASLRSGLHAG